MKDVRQYIADVKSGKRNAGLKEIAAVKRFEKLCKHKDYYFDKDEVERVFTISKMFIHTSGDYMGKQFTLLPWQKFGIAHIFGIKKKSTKKRLTRKAFFEIAKKNGKTEFAGFLGIYLTFFDGEKGAEVYSASNKYEQARFAWNAGRLMCQHLAKNNETFDAVCKIGNSINNRQIENTEFEGFFKPIPKDPKTLDGTKASAAIIDEYHEARTDDVLRNLSSAMVNRSQPLLVIITTAGFNINGPCHEYEKVGRDILDGKKTDDTSFILIFQADEKDDWHDKKTWEKSNPSLGVTPTMEGLEVEYQKALIEGASAEVNFKTKNLNQWVAAKEVWISDRIWKKKQTKWKLEDMEGEFCFQAFDLSNSVDVTAVGLLFPPNEERKQFYFHIACFIPEDTAMRRSKKDGVPYVDWHNEGLINYTSGDWIDYEHIENVICGHMDGFKVHSIAYDNWQSESTAQRLIKEGVNEELIRPFRQTTRMFNEPIKLIEKLVNKGQINHGNNKVLRWMAGNVVIHYDTNGLMKFDKKKSKDKIDGMVVLGMCFGEYLDFMKSEKAKAYEDHGVRFI